MTARQQSIGILSLAGFLFTVPFANWWLNTYGMWTAPILGPIPSGLWVIAISFVLRDIAQLALGRMWAWVAIAIGTTLSWWLASPALAVASGIAFLISETTDAAIFTPLANKGRFLLAVMISGYAAGFVDSALFVRIAFGSFDGWWQLGVAKAIVILAATPFAWVARRGLLR